MHFARASLFAAILMLGSGVLVASQIDHRWGAIAIMLFAGIAACVAIGMGRVPDAQANVASQQLDTAPAASAAATPLYRHPEFQNVIDSLGFPVLLIQDGMVRAANEPAQLLLGRFIIDADIRSAIRHPAAADLNVSIDSDHATKAVALTGVGRPGESWTMRVAPLSAREQVILLNDVTEREALDRMRADFVANASHELRTPLAGVLGYLETLHDPAAGGDAVVRERFLGIAEKEARRMQRLVEDLMSISRIEAGGNALPDDKIDMVELTRTVTGELTAAGSDRARDITMSGTEHAQVRGDRAQLSQLIHNLLSNAMKYGRAETTIAVALSTNEGGMLEIRVADQGDGIAAEHLPRLTERFYRVDSARSRELGGTGLGLSIVRHIINRHRGRLDIDSTPGVGTTVHVRLPLA
jgi:two-component system phosphate regulon sensor histidine kinase PhoR